MRISLGDSFLHALAELSASDVKRVAAFLDKLVHEPDAAGLRPEVVHDAADRAIRSLKISHDLRAIARIEGDRLLLLWAARHDRAYTWAREHCFECDPLTSGIDVVERPDGGHEARDRLER